MAKHVINNPGGRKPLPEEEKYGKPIPVRFTQKQFVRIKRKAGEMPISTYIREGALHAIVRQPVSKELMKEIRDLNNLGTNINTLVKLAHQAGFMVIANKASEALDGVNAILHQARLKINLKSLKCLATSGCTKRWTRAAQYESSQSLWRIISA